MFTHPHPVLSASPSDPQKIHYAVARINDYPALLLKSLRVVRSLCQFLNIKNNIADICGSFGQRVLYSGLCYGVRFDGGEKVAYHT
jgi:hypothetical protein